MRFRISLLVFAALLFATALSAARPGKGIIATTTIAGQDLSNVIHLLSLPASQQVPGLRNAALHQATALQEGIESIAEEDTSKMDEAEIQDLAAFFISTEATLADLQQQIAALDLQELGGALTQCSRALAATEQTLQDKDPAFGDVLYTMRYQ